MNKEKIMTKINTVVILILTVLFITGFMYYTLDSMSEDIKLRSEQILSQNNDLITKIDLLEKEKENLLEELAIKDSELDSLSKDFDKLIDKNNSLSLKVVDLSNINQDLIHRSQYIFNGEWNYDYTDEDIKILAAVMYGENDIYGRWEMMLTGSVVLNRVISDKFPNTVKDVVYQIDGGYEQYAPRTKNLIGSEEVTEEAYKLAEILLKYGPVAPEFVLYQAHFNQGNVYWYYEGEEFCYK